MAALSTTLILKVLDGLSQRAEATAQNIANAGTPNYRPLRVTFESALAAAARQGPEAVKSLAATVERDPDPAHADLRLDMELATASATGLRYAALIEILNRQQQVLGLPLAGNH
jgi:flagellar basal-body rod protein FlgB